MGDGCARRDLHASAIFGYTLGIGNYPLEVMTLGVLHSDAIKCPYWRAAGRDVLVWGALMSSVNQLIKLDQQWPDIIGKLQQVLQQAVNLQH